VSAAVGTPLSCPAALLKLAQAGLFAMENVRLPPDGSVVVGVNEYGVPTATLVSGEPEIVGPETPPATAIAKAGREAFATPSVTLITMPG